MGHILATGSGEMGREGKGRGGKGRAQYRCTGVKRGNEAYKVTTALLGVGLIINNITADSDYLKRSRS
jgi:hypothetical protein